MTSPKPVFSASALSVPAACVLALLALAACARPPAPGRAEATPAQRTACRQRVDEVYLQQNRGELYRSDNYVSGSRDTPFSTSAQPNFGSGLGAQYSREQALEDCLNASSGPINAAPPAPATAK